MSFKIDECNIKELVEQGIRGVVRQGCASVASGGYRCMYRHHDNPEIKCVVGHMIPDEVYDPSMEGLPVRHLGVVSGDDLGDTLRTLQYIHDYNKDSGDFVNKFLTSIGSTNRLPQWVKDIATKVKQEVDNEQSN